MTVKFPLFTVMFEPFRMLNLALVDVGAGTSDICVTDDGSITAYGMLPIAGDDITAMDFQKEVENYTEVVKFANQTNDLTEEQNNALRDEVWAIMVRNYILEKAAAQIGLTVTDEEVKEVIERGNDPVLTSTPFSQDGKFDADVLKLFNHFI